MSNTCCGEFKILSFEWDGFTEGKCKSQGRESERDREVLSVSCDQTFDQRNLREKGFICLFSLQLEDIQSSKVAKVR